MIPAILFIVALTMLIGSLLSVAAARLRTRADGAVEAVDRLLPQTQCAQCGFPGCRPYAEAVVEGSAAINLCPPGGDETVRRLARLLGKDVMPLAEAAVEAVAVIDEAACIGCYHCRNACPVDAIVGAPQFMHTVIAAECTGCVLCVAPCPVDCIEMRPVS